MIKRPLLLAFLAGPILASPLRADDKVTFNDHVLPVFKNACLNCHNPDKKKAGLDLSTFASTIAGSDNGKVLNSGDPGASLLVKCVKQTEEPKMPPKGDKLTDAELAIIEKWVAGQLLESGSSKAIAPSNNVQLTVISLEKPQGPPPMPTTDLPLEPLVRTKGNNALVALAASPWAPLVAVGGQKQIVLYNTETLKTLGILPFPEGFPAVVRFSRNGQLLLTGGGLGGKSGKVVLWNVQTGERIGQVGDEFDQVLGADISPDHAFVALGGPTKLLKIYATKDGKLVESIKKHTDWVTAVAFSPDGKYLASADRGGAIEVWEGASGKPYTTLPGHKAMVTGLAFMPGVLASASEDGKISLWDVKEGKELRSWAAHAGGASSVDFTADGRLVSAGRDKLAKAWDQTGKALLTSQPFRDIALRAVMSNERVIAGDWTGQIRVFNLADGRPLGEITANPPLIAESLAAAQKRVADLQGQAATAQRTAEALEAKIKADLAALEGKRQADLAASEALVKKSASTAASLKLLVPALEKLLGAEKETVAALTQIRETAPEAERAEPQAKLAAQTTKAGETEAGLNQAKADLAALATPERQRALVEATALAENLRKNAPKLPPSPESVARAQAAQKDLAEKQAAEARLAETLAKLTEAKQDGKAVQAKLDEQKKQVAQATQTVQTANTMASNSPEEQQLALAKAQVGQAQAQLPAANADVAHWVRAQEFMAVHNAELALTDLTNRQAQLAAAIKEALAPIEQAGAAIAAQEKAAAMAAALVSDKEAEAAKSPADPEAAKVAEAARTIAASEGKKLAALKEKLPAVTAAANAAKAEAEQKAAAAGQELEAAKAQAGKLRAAYGAKYPGPAAGGKPIAAQ